ncbi:MAG: hypothetical protein Fur0017_12520 [Anaerolineales bacterium]
MTYKHTLLFTAVILALAGCDARPATPLIPTPEFVTATLPPTPAPAASQTPPPPSPAPTITPVTGTTTTEVNVRAGTSTASESLGTMPPFSAVQIVGKDVSGNWLRILFQDGAGWVRADFVQVTDASAEIPVWDSEAGNGSVRGVVLRGINVRNGPGQNFESLGLLNQNDVVSILEKDPSGTWIKIEYPAAPDAVGWVAAEFLQIENVDAIPTFAVTAEAIATKGVEAPEIPAPAQTAWMDGDSADFPLADFLLLPNSYHTVQFQGWVSAPGGDLEDWLTFVSQSDDVVIQVLCDSSGVKVELLSSVEAPNLLELNCGDVQKVQTVESQRYYLKISSLQTGAPVFIEYKLKIKINKH